MDQTSVSLVNIKIAYIAFAIHSPQNISPGVVSKFGNQTLKVGLSSFQPIHIAMFGHPGTPPLSHESRVADSDSAQNVHELPKMLTPVLFPNLRHHVFGWLISCKLSPPEAVEAIGCTEHKQFPSYPMYIRGYKL